MFKAFLIDTNDRRTLVHQGDDLALAVGQAEHHLTDKGAREAYKAVRFVVEGEGGKSVRWGTAPKEGAK